MLAISQPRPYRMLRAHSRPQPRSHRRPHSASMANMRRQTSRRHDHPRRERHHLRHCRPRSGRYPQRSQSCTTRGCKGSCSSAKGGKEGFRCTKSGSAEESWHRTRIWDAGLDDNMNVHVLVAVLVCSYPRRYEKKCVGAGLAHEDMRSGSTRDISMIPGRQASPSAINAPHYSMLLEALQGIACWLCISPLLVILTK